MGKFFKQSKAEDPKDLKASQAVLLSQVAAGAGMGLGQSVASTMIDPEKFMGPKRDKMPKKVWEAARGFRKKHKLKTKIYSGSAANTFPPGPHYQPFKGIRFPFSKFKMPVREGVHIDRPTKKHVVLHELGHAADFKKFRRTKAIGRMAGIPAGIVGAGVLLKDDKKRKYAPAATAAGFAPLLWQEGKASILATKYVKETEGRRAAKRVAKPLLRAFGTYVTLPVGAALGVYTAGKLLNKTRT